ncbi:hypothetical protein [Helicobacter turcicus]|uniref:Lipid/polyisoprenoid-binding YceI-like domain-containing protein n=1 Tax=Helicobacter turcicus TaxID=2867412 RepID=A0ABS7JN45_9HELI|nr:hypothetical protein [Helicobacter turcicus]MBX7490802.1 hypothetical protein [Helicobacter turcicus]MBX7545589.1 hypothetical protein [Helicobacter turcicus]
MKKLLVTAFGSLILSSALFATGLDEKSIQIGFEGYKTPTMAGTKGIFSTAKFNFKKDDSTLAKQLIGASVILSPKNIDMGGEENQVITDNVVNAFFGTLNNKNDIKVEIVNVIEGEYKGAISAKVTINRQSTIVPLNYEILGNKDFQAQGRLDLSAFSNTPKALKALSDVAAGHLGISWNIVDITVKGKLK